MRQGRDVAGADQAKKIGKAIPEKRMYDVNAPLMAGRIPSTYIHGIKEALLEEERIGAIGTGKAQPSLDPGCTQRDVFAVAVGRDELGVVIGVETACHTELPEL
jgi:hypothetical protein